MKHHLLPALSVVTLLLSPCVATPYTPNLTRVLEDVQWTFEKLNEVCSWDPVRLVKEGDILRVSVSGSLKYDIEEQSFCIWISAHVNPVAEEERVERLSKLSMQYGIYSWRAPEICLHSSSNDSDLYLLFAPAQKGTPIRVDFLSLVTGRDVVNPLPAPVSIRDYNLELDCSVPLGVDKKIPLREQDFLYRLNHGLKDPSLKGKATLAQAGSKQGSLNIHFYSPTEALAKGGWVIDGKPYYSDQFILRLIEKKEK